MYLIEPHYLIPILTRFLIVFLLSGLLATSLQAFDRYLAWSTRLEIYSRARYQMHDHDLFTCIVISLHVVWYPPLSMHLHCLGWKRVVFHMNWTCSSYVVSKFSVIVNQTPTPESSAGLRLQTCSLIFLHYVSFYLFHRYHRYCIFRNARNIAIHSDSRKNNNPLNAHPGADST